jgi:hypothetical protein
MANPIPLYSQKDLPDTILDIVEGLDWNQLIDALNNGLPANLMSLGDVSLYERVLSELETSRPDRTTASLQAPLELLEAFIQNGLAKGVFQEATMTAVGLACVYGQWLWIPRLIEAGYEIEGPDIGRSSVLHALIDGRYQRSFDFGDQDDDNSTPVGLPLSVDTTEEFERAAGIVLFLAQQGVRLNDLDTDEELEASKLSPLGRAVCVCDEAAVQGLILAGADMTLIQKTEGFSGRPLDLAIMMGSDDTVRLLLGAGAPVDANPASPWLQSNPTRALPLCLAASMGRKEIIEDIIGEMDPQDLAQASVRALHLAACCDQLGAFTELLILGVPMDARADPNGFTPMHQAALNGATTVIDFLLEQGVSWNVESTSGVPASATLLQAQPHLAQRYGLQVAPTDNVRYLGLRRSMKH